MSTEYHPGKFDSFRDSALHYLCSGEWGNASFGDVTDYGVYVWRISNSWEEVKPEAMDFTSVIEEWAPMEGYETLHADIAFRQSLVGHFLVSENSQGQVSVRQFPSEAALLARFNDMQAHYEEWVSEGEPND